MVPKPPFDGDLTAEEENAAFSRLKLRLSELWPQISARDDAPHTTVVVPSLTLDPAELAKVPGVAHYEERLLFMLMRLRNPHARLVYVTSQPIHPLVIEYYLQLLSGIPASHARARLTLLSAHDHSPRPLTQKILERPRLVERIRVAIEDPSRAFVDFFNTTPLERRLAVLLGIPMNALDPDLVALGTKTGSRRVFEEAAVDHAAGAGGLRSLEEIEEALVDLGRARPGLRCAVLKLDHSFAGEGNALLRCPDGWDRDGVRRGLEGLVFSMPEETVASYLDKFARTGGVVEELLGGEEIASPSVQLRVDPHGQTTLSSTHEQILGGPTSQSYRGCLFPAHERYRARLQEAGLRIGRVLAAKGVVSRFSVDFLARRQSGEREWDLRAVEINLRMGGTTHPMLALRFLTGGRLDPGSGLFLAPSGQPKYYKASDHLQSDRYRGLLPEDLIEILTYNRLAFDHRTETGVLFHMIGAVSQYGKVGVVAIANDRREAEQLFSRTGQILDHETRYGRER